MGQMVSKLNEMYLVGQDKSNLQESKGILHDTTADEADLNINNNGDLIATPPGIAKLRCDPRSPSHFDRTPIKE